MQVIPMNGGRAMTQPSQLAGNHMNIQDSSKQSLKPKGAFRNTLNIKKGVQSRKSLKGTGGPEKKTHIQ